MMLAATPVLLPLLTATLTALFAGRPALQRALSAAGSLAFVLCAALLVARAGAGEPVRCVFGGWPAPFGIEFAIDRLGAALILVTALLGAAVLLFQGSDADPAPRSPYLLPLVHALLAGVGASFATADLFNLYVWFELMLMASVGLLALGGAARHLDGTLKYLVLGLVGTLLLLTGVALLYGATGHVNFEALSGVPMTPLLTAIVALIALAFLVKAGAFPLFAWLPASYPTLPAPLLALFAGLLTKVGAYAVLRLLADVFRGASPALSGALGWVAAATMVAGVLGAASQWDLRRILAFHIVSQIGYILLAIALGTDAGVTAAIFYTLHHIIVKANLCLIAGIVFRMTGSYDLRRIGGLSAARPALAALFLVPALALVGVPPLSGFWAKLLVLGACLDAGRGTWLVLGLLVSLLTLYSMLKVWVEAFWKPHPDPRWEPPRDAHLRPAYAATVGLALLTLAIGFFPQVLLDYAAQAAATLGRGP